MKHFIVTLLVGFWLLGPHAFADVNAKNGISITTASTINGKTPNSAFNGLTIVSGGGGGPALIANVGATAGVSGGTTSSINTTGANFAVIAVCWYDAITATPTVSDNKSNSWTQMTRTESNDVGVAFFYTQGGTFGTGHTFTVSGTDIYSCMFVQAWSNISVTPADTQNGAVASGSTTIQPGSITPSQSNVIVVTATSNNDSGLVPSSINSSFTISNSTATSTGANVGGGMAYLIVTDGSAQNPTWTYSGTFEDASARIAAFKY